MADIFDNELHCSHSQLKRRLSQLALCVAIASLPLVAQGQQEQGQQEQPVQQVSQAEELDPQAETLNSNPQQLAATESGNTLAAIYELALQNDPVLRAAQASYLANIENENLAKSRLLPQVSTSYQFSRGDQYNTSISPTGFGETIVFGTASQAQDTDRKAINLDLQQNIFNLPAWFSFKQGKELSAVAEAQFASDQQSLIIRVTEAYFNALRARDNLDTALAEERAIGRQLEQTERRFEVGLIAITDVHEARAAHDLAVVSKLEAEGQLGIAYENLTVITGESHSNIWLLGDTFPVTSPDPATRAEWVDFALENNYQLKVARLSEDAALMNSKSKRSEHLPKLSGSYSYSDTKVDGTTDGGSVFNPGIVDNPSHGDTIGLNLSLPLYAGGSISSGRRQAAQEHIRARENHIAAQRNAVQGTRSLHLAVITDIGKVNARKLSITSAESALEATQAGYEVGTRNVVDVLNAQRFLYRAVRDYSNARYDYVVNLLRLKQQAGILTPQDVYDLNKWLAQPPAPTASTTPR